ncbi:MAG TPA: hypothetical protein VEL28_21540 [Candidatus Binatia bacterium]|nr:hypothetical protein [Candidatus Binatia bacterium]
MEQNFEDLLRVLRDSASNAFDGAFSWSSESATSTSVSTLLRPIDPYNRWPFLAPVIGAAGFAALVALTGIAVGALLVMLAALALVGFLLTEVFGYELALNPNVRP